VKSTRIPALVARFLAFVLFVGVLVLSKSAHAYPWMIRHEETSCSSCHVDPSGAGLLTSYGRQQAEAVLRTHYGATKDDEPSSLGEFAFGAVTLPKWLQLQPSFRFGLLGTVEPKVPARFLVMQGDMLAGVNMGRFASSVSVGYVDEGARGAAITRGDEHRLISRLYWAGYKLGAQEEVLIRAGRMNIPFGLRNIEHTSWVRSETRTDINAAQQTGLAVSFQKGIVRAEAMALLGNYHVSPDAFRSRGYSAFGEFQLDKNFTFGGSSMITYASEDEILRSATFRHAHGIFSRYVPTKMVVLMGEFDFLAASREVPNRLTFGHTSRLTADVEPIGGVHIQGSFETLLRDARNDELSYGGWLTGTWFFLPHAEARLDLIVRHENTAGRSFNSATLFGQLHFFL
jgi:hypothetical protein